MRTRICFAPPGWFAADGGVRVSLDGETVHDGSFLSGFAHELELAPGTHTLEAKLGLAFARPTTWTLEVPEDDAHLLDVRLTYSRAWGKFEKALDVRVVDAFDPIALAVEPEPSALDQERAKRPLRATWALLATLVVVYAAELVLGVDDTVGMTPSLPTLVAMGGLAHPAITDGQWYRVVSCIFLHASPIHLIFNGIALVIAGSILERIVGWRFFLALYFAGGLGGSALSLIVNDETLVSVGASGAIMGLFASGLVLSQTLPASQRGPVQMGLLRMLIPSLLPMFQQGDMRVDYGAHFGGAIAGAIAGGLLLAAMRAATKRDESIDRSPVATGMSAAFVAASAVALIAVITLAYPSARAELATVRALVPDTEIVSDVTPTVEQVRGWSTQYPDDPRVQLMATELAFDDEAWSQFDEHLARGRALMPRYAHVFPPESVEAMLAALAQLEQRGSIRRQLLPNRALPSGTEDEIHAAWSANLPSWLEHHPTDPRVREQAAWRALSAGAFDEAERHARAGLEVAPRFAELFPSGNASEPGLRAVLALVLHQRGAFDEAAPLTAGLCGGADGSELQALVFARGLCDPR